MTTTDTNATYSYLSYASPLGVLYVVARGGGELVELGLGAGALKGMKKKYGPLIEDPRPSRRAVALRVLTRLEKLFDRYFRGDKVRFDFKVAPEGTEFQRRVWRALMKIPYGEVWSYKDVAEKIGCPGAARAVGGACSANPLPIIIPCHRVVASSGALGGFSMPGGALTKRKLLVLEGRENMVTLR